MINKRFNFSTIEETPIWKSAYKLALFIYKVSHKFPKSEVYGLTSQIRRSASSIGANITEGYNRNTTKELVQFFVHCSRFVC